MPRQEEDEGPKEYHRDEQQAGYLGNTPNLWNEDVKDREELKPSS